jgi:hypothetical protein
VTEEFAPKEGCLICPKIQYYNTYLLYPVVPGTVYHTIREICSNNLSSPCIPWYHTVSIKIYLFGSATPPAGYSTHKQCELSDGDGVWYISMIHGVTFFPRKFQRALRSDAVLVTVSYLRSTIKVVRRRSKSSSRRRCTPAGI